MTPKSHETDIKKKKNISIFFFWEFHGFRFKSAIPRIPRLFRDRGKSLALLYGAETWTMRKNMREGRSTLLSCGVGEEY